MRLKMRKRNPSVLKNTRKIHQETSVPNNAIVGMGYRESNEIKRWAALCQFVTDETRLSFCIGQKVDCLIREYNCMKKSHRVHEAIREIDVINRLESEGLFPRFANSYKGSSTHTICNSTRYTFINMLNEKMFDCDAFNLSNEAAVSKGIVHLLTKVAQQEIQLWNLTPRHFVVNPNEKNSYMTKFDTNHEVRFVGVHAHFISEVTGSSKLGFALMMLVSSCTFHFFTQFTPFHPKSPFLFGLMRVLTEGSDVRKDIFDLLSGVACQFRSYPSIAERDSITINRVFSTLFSDDKFRTSVKDVISTFPLGSMEEATKKTIYKC